MTVIVSIEEAGPSKKRLTVEVPADDVAEETRQVVSDYGRNARIPGFRKGKVPTSVVMQRYRESIEREVVERLIPRFWSEAEKEGDLQPLASPEVEEVGELSSGEPLTFSATVEVRPEIAIGDLEGFELPERDVEPTDEEVSAALDDLRRRVADWIPADRPAARGDRVKAHIRELPTGSPDAASEEAAAERGAAGEDEPEAAEKEAEEVVVEVGDPRVWEELSLALTGLTAGQQGRFTRRPEGDGEARTFELEVGTVEERDLPSLDDELAAKLGDFDSVDALRQEVVDGLRSNKRSELARERHKALLEQLRARYPVQVPHGVVDHEVEHLLTDYASELGRRGVDPQAAQVDWQSLSSQARPEAERRVHDKLILDAVAEHWELEVEPSDLAGALATIARARGESVAALRASLEESGRLPGLAAQIRRDKTVRRLLGEEEPEAEADTAGAAPGEAPEEDQGGAG